LNCGFTKWGAFCPCSACHAGSTGDFKIDIAFSEHHLSRSTLEQLGVVIKAIAGRTDEQELRFWSFIEYVSRNHPEILSVELKAEVRERVEAVLSGLEVPQPVEVVLSGLEEPQAPVRPRPRLRWCECLFWIAALAALIRGVYLRW
jgi:hypothetical protein